MGLVDYDDDDDEEGDASGSSTPDIAITFRNADKGSCNTNTITDSLGHVIASEVKMSHEQKDMETSTATGVGSNDHEINSLAPAAKRPRLEI